MLSMAWNIGCSIYRGEIPVVHDIAQATITYKMFDFPVSKLLAHLTILIYISPIISGTLLIAKKKAGLIISYIQTPFRLILVIPPSIFFILWPLPFTISQKAVLWLGVILILISESIKISTLIIWHKRRMT